MWSPYCGSAALVGSCKWATNAAAGHAIDKAIVEIELLLNDWCSAAGNGDARLVPDGSERVVGGSYE